MAVEKVSGGTSLIDVLDRVLDKGIVIDAWVRVSLVGIDLITVEARIVVASIDTYLKYSEAVGQVTPVARPSEITHEDVVAERDALLEERERLRRGMEDGGTATDGPAGIYARLRPGDPPRRPRKPLNGRIKPD